MLSKILETMFGTSQPTLPYNLNQNQIMVIKPYLYEGIWVFDDPRVGLVKEALVAGMPEIIMAACQDEGITDPQSGFVVLFSADPFPGHTVKLDKCGTEFDGTWYEWKEKGLKGWLCPALFRYFPAAPHTIYCQPKQAE